MKHLPTTVLLDLAEDYKDFSKYPSGGFKEGAAKVLSFIDSELLSRMPEGEFITVLDDSGNPVGFEPEDYVIRLTGIDNPENDYLPDISYRGNI